VIPVDVYTLTEVGYVAWQCERREGLHVNADTHLVEVLRGREAAGPGMLGRVVITDLYNRAMPFLRYDTGDLAIAGNGNCACGREFPCIRSFEGRQRDAIRLRDGCTITSRSVVDHMAQVLPPEAYQLHQETTDRFRLEVFSCAKQAVGAVPHEAPGLPGNDVLVNHLRELLGDVEISIQMTSPPRVNGEKTYPVVANSPALFT
jgi:phenylacetate-CoA ligase